MKWRIEVSVVKGTFAAGYDVSAAALTCARRDCGDAAETVRAVT
jgi:hypothetical protein